ncbi:MAG: FtsW/RodA/SpoVE family cell cycle protein [Butyricicoccus sp.]
MPSTNTAGRRSSARKPAKRRRSPAGRSSAGRPAARRMAGGRSQASARYAAGTTARRPAQRPAQRTRATQPARRKKKQGTAFMSNGLLGDYRKPLDLPLLLTTLMLLGAGLVVLMSASYPSAYYDPDKGALDYVIKQGMVAVVGLALMFFLSAFDYHRYHVLGKGIYLAAVILLLMVLTPLGTTINNSRRWIFGFQPSELAKLAVILTFSSFISLHPERIRSIRGLIPYGAALGVLAALLAVEPHMSAIIILGVIAVAVLFVGGMRLWYFIPVGVIGTVGAVAAYMVVPHVKKRIAVWLDPFIDATGDGWQGSQSLIAIGSGGLFGRGLGQSRQKFLYLPEPMNDFIFSVVCEELGFIGALLFLIMFAYFLFRGFHIAMRSPDRFGSLIAAGITTQFAFQILLNLAVVSGLFPVTGASLPFFSYGGTALLMQLIEVGILLNISRHIPPSRRE